MSKKSKKNYKGLNGFIKEILIIVLIIGIILAGLCIYLIATRNTGSSIAPSRIYETNQIK